MSKEQNIYKQLLAQGFSKQEIDDTVYKIIMHQVACKKAYEQLSFARKLKWHIKRYSEQVSGFFMHLTAKGLVLLKTQFAKKPRNPI